MLWSSVMRMLVVGMARVLVGAMLVTWSHVAGAGPAVRTPADRPVPGLHQQRSRKQGGDQQARCRLGKGAGHEIVRTVWSFAAAYPSKKDRPSWSLGAQRRPVKIESAIFKKKMHVQNDCICS
ncbi:MAG: hypothetical protein KF708_22825 [Pirellulales bacterium]|nr:hypothetical protein [Pirellulales bacterium]